MRLRHWRIKREASLQAGDSAESKPHANAPEASGDRKGEGAGKQIRAYTLDMSSTFTQLYGTHKAAAAREYHPSQHFCPSDTP